MLMSTWGGATGVEASKALVRNLDRASNVPLHKQQIGLRRLPLRASASMTNEFNAMRSQDTESTLGAFFNCRAGQSTPSLLFVTNQMMNIATTMAVASGFLGSWIASILLCKLQKIAAALNTSTGTYHRKLTIASSGLYFMLKCRKTLRTLFARSLVNTLIGGSDLGIVVAILTYSVIIDPVLGGLIGCSCVSVDLVSSILRFIDTDELKTLRLTPLDKDGNMVASADLPKTKTYSFRAILAHAISSTSLLASTPQYFLTLYMLSSAILNYFMENSHNKGLGNVISWLSTGLLNIEMKPRSLSARLLALHMSVMIMKGIAASILL